MVQQTITAPPAETQTEAPSPATPARMTYEEFRASVPDDVRAEWVDGEVILLMPPSLRHQLVSQFLSMLLSLFAGHRELGIVVSAPFGMRLLDGKSYREPDIIFVSSEHASRIGENWLVGAADLVIEIVSDESIARDRRDKLAEYATSGIVEYWVIDPRPSKESISLYHLSEEGYYEFRDPDPDGRFKSEVVEGFWIKLDWISANPLPFPLAILAEMAPEVLLARPR